MHATHLWMGVEVAAFIQVTDALHLAAAPQSAATPRSAPGARALGRGRSEGTADSNAAVVTGPNEAAFVSAFGGRSGEALRQPRPAHTRSGFHYIL